VLEGVTLDQLRVFLAIAEAGSFRKGAAQVRRAQSAVSYAIANLESQLGVALFDRSAHRPRLTKAGEVLLEDARGVLLKMDFLRARARGIGQGVETELSIVVDALFPLPVLGAALVQLRSRFPAVRPHVSVLALGGPPTALRDRRCDLAVMVGEEFFDPRLECDRLQPIALVTVAAASHPLLQQARARRLTASELAEHPQVVLEDPTNLSEGRTFDVIAPLTVCVAHMDAKRALILAGVGWGRLPRWTIQAELDAGTLARLPTTKWGSRGETVAQSYLARRMDDALGPAGQHLRELLLQADRASGGPRP
jgi:DNA-binding transcriptional LysR family regulator